MKKFDFQFSPADIVLKKNQLRKSISKKVIQQANRILKDPLPDTRYSLFRAYHMTGDRDAYQKPLFEKKKKFILLAMAYYLTGKQKYLLLLQDYLWEICNLPVWSLPAHLPERLNFEKTYIDLGCSATAARVAEVLALFEKSLDENIKSRIRYELEKRIFIPFYQHPEDYGWFKRYYSNWCSVCCGNIGIATMLAGKDGVYFEKILNDVTDAINNYLDNFDSSGGWAEGISYWNYGITPALKYADILYQATNGKINLFNHPKLQVTGLFPIHCFLPPDNFVSFGDSHFPVFLTRETMLLLAKHTKPGRQISWLLKRISLRDFEDLATLKKIKIPHPKVPEETFIHFKDIGWVITRKTWKEKNTPVLAVKAGCNGEPHNQLDTGHFIFHVFGEDYLCDYGAGKYTKNYFGPARYENPFCNAEGHSLIFIDGKSQGVGKEFSGKIIQALHNTQQDIISIDLTAAYPEGLTSKVIRTLKFSKKQKYGALLLEDFVETNTERIIETRLQYKGNLKKLDRSRFLLSGKKGKVAINILEPKKILVSRGYFKNLPASQDKMIDIKFLKIATKSSSVRFLIEILPFA
ncbi:MAG: heparinase II/III-family protein [Candidatus Omnitrophica bacterium]|nr:heparinase II/III-family protein [Candidatus Omnitrophota bacterium]